EGSGPVGGGAEGQRAGMANAVVPIIGQDKRRVLGDGVNVSGCRLLVVVGGADARRAAGQEQQGGGPEGDVGIEETGDILVAEVEGALRGQAERGQQDQFACRRPWLLFLSRLLRPGRGRVLFFWQHHGNELPPTSNVRRFCIPRSVPLFSFYRPPGGRQWAGVARACIIHLFTRRGGRGNEPSPQGCPCPRSTSNTPGSPQDRKTCAHGLIGPSRRVDFSRRWN